MNQINQDEKSIRCEMKQKRRKKEKSLIMNNDLISL